MPCIALGRTGIEVEKNGFGCLPIQRIPQDDAVRLLRKARDAGIRFFDTARGYSDSERKLGIAFEGLRGTLFIASKTPTKTPEVFWEHLKTSLENLRTDYLDLYQFHNPAFCPRPGDGTGLYECMLEAKRRGLIRHIGISNHRLPVAREAVASGLYETLQFPFTYLATEKDLELVAACADAGMGFIAMKALAGGLVTDAAAACAYLNQFPHVLPIWGIQKEAELDQFIGFIASPPRMTGTLAAAIEKDRAELLGEFCRGCGYCMPCPAGIEISLCARMSLMIRRSPPEGLLKPETRAKMRKVEDCLHCDACSAKCPYGLDTPRLLEKNYSDYREILAGKPL
jgi:predicted aldo/keto reductase-like oxidoreductase